MHRVFCNAEDRAVVDVSFSAHRGERWGVEQDLRHMSSTVGIFDRPRDLVRYVYEVRRRKRGESHVFC